ncbi:secreted protein [Legionella sainthelensi]|uniref:hypothetical protein n=1 Tax=Legionella sainthelensi TaxID=28087 RepID=UPI000E20ADD7|nr:hypothetical protein [Legionella sainthelensi]VEB38949.1 secreted protein [Legionella sainthelensi]
MIKRILLISIAFFLFYGPSSWAENKGSIIRPGNFFKVSAYVDTLTVTTVTPNWTYPKAGIKILTPGYTVAHINPTNNGYYLFSVSDTVPAKLTLLGPPGTVSAQLCLSGVGKGSSCELQTITVTKQKYAYVASGFNQIVYKCQVNSDGTLSRCEPAHSPGVPSWIPESIAFATVNGIQYAYVASWPNGVVYQCTLNSEGSFDTCNALTPTGTFYSYAAGITFATINGIQYAYVSDDVANVYQCTLNNDGTFNTCIPTPTASTLGWIPVSTTFATIGGAQYAYVASDNGNLYQCSLNFGGLTNGTFNSCTIITPASGSPNWLPKSVTFATFGANAYAYVSDDNGDVFRCSLNSDGTFNQCSETPGAGILDWSPRTVAFETFGGTQYAYVADYGTATSLFGDIYQCTLSAEGKFTSCVPTPVFGVVPWVNLWWVAFN